jgi:hypothetical protein
MPVVAICRGTIEVCVCWRREGKTEGASIGELGMKDVACLALCFIGSAADGPVKAWQIAGSSARNATRKLIVVAERTFFAEPRLNNLFLMFFWTFFNKKKGGIRRLRQTKRDAGFYAADYPSSLSVFFITVSLC